MNAVIYSEQVQVGLMLKSILVSVLSFFFFFLLMNIAVDNPEVPFLAVLFPSVIAFLIFLFWNYRVLEIAIDSKGIMVKYGLFNQKHILFEEIVSCEPVKVSFKKYGGVGVRFGMDGSWAYTTSFGNAIRLVMRKGRPFVFSTNNSEEICKIIKKPRNKE